MTGKRVAWYFIAFFGFIAAVNAVMMTLAIRTHSGTVTDHPYEKGLAYNQVVEAENAQAALGWQGEIRYADDLIVFILKDKNGTTITPDNAKATFTRPTQSGIDFSVELQGEQTPVTFSAKGIWHVRVDAVVGDKNFQQSKRIVVE
ncbi:MAG: FixH family protein [Pseudomonadota bacterium]